MRPGWLFDQKKGMLFRTYVPIHAAVGRFAHPRNSRRRVLPWAALGFSIIWGTVIGLAATRGASGLAAFAGVGMLFTLALTVLLYRQQAELRDLVETDPLTGLLNHRGFQQALRARAREGAGEARLGRPSSPSTSTISRPSTSPRPSVRGRRPARESARSFASRSAAADIAARIGGEEFALILPEHRRGGGTARSPSASGRPSPRLSPAGSELTCSAGVAVFPVDADDAGALLQLAEGALYWAKRSGKSPHPPLRPRPRPPQRWTHRSAPRSSGSSRSAPIEPVFQPVASPHHGPPDRLRGARPLPRRPERAALDLVRPGQRLRPRARARGRGDPGGARAASVARPERHLAVNVSPSALSSDVGQERAARRSLRDRHRDHRARGLRRRRLLATSLARAARARREDRDRRRRRRLRRAQAGDVGPPRHRQARSRADPRDPPRPGADGARRVARALRPPRRRDRLRRGDREPRRHRGARQPRRARGDRATRSAAPRPVERGLPARRRDLPHRPRQTL